MGVFAHPDDETFGPGGTLALYASLGHEVYTFTATKGQAGQASSLSITTTVGDCRTKELQNATKILGATEAIISDFFDGTLNESQIPLLKKIITQEIERIKPDILIIFEPGGISQHLDHIAVTKSVIQLFDEGYIFPKKIYYYGLPKQLTQYLGRAGGIDEKKGARINISSVWKTKIQAMKAHRTQKADYTRILQRYDDIKKTHKELWQNEFFELARTAVKNISLPESDLLSGIKED